jgi:hypothetical protein
VLSSKVVLTISFTTLEYRLLDMADTVGDIDANKTNFKI